MTDCDIFPRDLAAVFNPARRRAEEEQDLLREQVIEAQRAALRELLGARVVLTGIRGDVAQTLVHLGEGLGGITTRSTLRAGIAWALRR
ncbi:hypothetical protein [Polyangium mundeleinium]|uniref:hypothetical protein n=1 Tax=Polyangium mundeleinium TaxID=2995306 RepID=UPI00280C0A2C|nr:hypothetical protein [Polyangium mundeleinium]